VKRTILHVDLDAFYASVEQRDDPSLRGRPVVVGGDARRGVVCAASYEARPFGVKSAMPMVTALRLCPHAVVLRPRFDHYATVSGEFFAILESYSPLVEGLSLDEAFLDVTGEERLFGDGPTIAQIIKERVRRELSLVASVGVAPSKFVAKIASDLRKPDGLVVVEAGELLEFLHPLPVTRLWGVGAVTAKLLGELGLRTIGDVDRLGEAALVDHLGPEHGRHLAALAAGRDERDVEPERMPVSIGHEDTFADDVRDRAVLRVHLLDQADRVAARLRGAGLRARVVTLKVKYADHERTSRRRSLARPTSDGQVLAQIAHELLVEVPAIERRGVRLTGISASGLQDRDGPRQMAFDEAAAARGEALGDAIDKIAAKFGRGSVRRAVHVAEPGAGDATPGPRSETEAGFSRGRPR
jgi:DNA polymerase-4